MQSFPFYSCAFKLFTAHARESQWLLMAEDSRGASNNEYQTFLQFVNTNGLNSLVLSLLVASV